MQQNSIGISCFTLHQEKKNLLLITSDFSLLINPNWIVVLEMNKILRVQWTGMIWCMNYPFTLLMQCFITSLPGIGTTLIFIHLFISKATRYQGKNWSFVGTTIVWSIWHFYYWHCGQEINKWNWVSWSYRDKMDWSFPTRWHWRWLRIWAFVFQSSQLYGWLMWWRIQFWSHTHQPFCRGRKMAEIEKGVQKVHSNYLIPYDMALRRKKKQKCYMSLWQCSSPYTAQCLPVVQLV